MEYTFKNSVSSKACSIRLLDKYLVVDSVESEKIIPYSTIRSIKLTRKKRNFFKLIIVSYDQLPVEVSNKYYLSARDIEDRSRHYAAFVKELHHKLLDTPVVFVSGNPVPGTLLGLVSSAFLGCLLSFFIEFAEMGIGNVFLQTTGFTLLFSVVIFSLTKNNLLEPYEAEEIPLHFIPRV